MSDKTKDEMKKILFENWMHYNYCGMFEGRLISQLVLKNLTDAYESIAFDVPTPVLGKQESAMHRKNQIAYDHDSRQYVYMKRDTSKSQYTLIEHMIAHPNRVLGSIEAVQIEPWTPVMNDYQIHSSIKKEYTEKCAKILKSKSNNDLLHALHDLHKAMQ